MGKNGEMVIEIDGDNVDLLQSMNGGSSTSYAPADRSPFRNETSIEPSRDVVPAFTRALTELLTIGAIHSHIPAIRRHVSDRAINMAIAKLQTVVREK